MQVQKYGENAVENNVLILTTEYSTQDPAQRACKNYAVDCTRDPRQYS